MENSDFRFMKEQALKEQDKEREQPLIFKCSKCGYTSTNPDDFTTENNKYVCFMCYYNQKL